MELSQDNFLIPTDGSSGSELVSFGWKICTIQGHMLAQHAGPALVQASSFSTRSLWDSINNESAITRIQQQKEYPYDYPFNTLASDWNIIAQIVALLNESNFNNDFEHVKGHQDKDK
eukprot:7285510-Ditylum_brightwellii.AAC.1